MRIIIKAGFLNNKYKIHEIKAGNQAEFRRIIDQNMNIIYAIALKITADEEDARDIVQDTFIKLWEKRRTIRDAGSLESLIKRIAVNKCYDLLRKKKRQKLSDVKIDTLNIMTCDGEADRNINNEEIRTVLNWLISKLSPTQKIVFSLIELEQLSHDEVASATGMSKSSIKSNLHHAKKKMEAQIKNFKEDYYE